MRERIRALYEEAGQLHARAKSILAEYEGKELPPDKAQEVDTLLDQVEAKTAEAKRLARLNAHEEDLASPAESPAFFKEGGQQEFKIKWNGRELTQDEVKELMAEANFKAFADTGDGLYQAYARAFRGFLRKGDRKLPANEFKDLSVGYSAAGGYLVQDNFLNTLIVKQREVSAMRRIANVLPPVPSGAVIVPAEDSIFSDAEWTTEAATGSVDTVQPFGQRRLQPHPLGKVVKVSNTLLRVPTFDVEAYVRDRLAYKFAVPEENAFINGDGTGKPLGILKTPGLPTYTTAASNTLSADDVINWVYSLPSAYAPNARILCNRAFIRKVRTLKDTQGNYVWQPGLSAGMPNTILDVPYEVSDRFDDGLDSSDVFEDNAIVAVVGDFSYYWIVDALGMTIQRLDETYALTNQTGFVGRKECDGAAVLAEAFYALKIKA